MKRPRNNKLGIRGGSGYKDVDLDGSEGALLHYAEAVQHDALLSPQVVDQFLQRPVSLRCQEFRSGDVGIHQESKLLLQGKVLLHGVFSSAGRMWRGMETPANSSILNVPHCKFCSMVIMSWAPDLEVNHSQGDCDVCPYSQGLDTTISITVMGTLPGCTAEIVEHFFNYHGWVYILHVYVTQSDPGAALKS